MKSKYGWVAIGVLIGLGLVFGAWWYTQANYRFRGSSIEPVMPAADFSLIDHTNTDYRLSDQKGKIVLIFFGYTHCPDVCPVTLSQYKQIKAQLGKNADQVSFIFITVDPERDTVAEMGRYVPNFDPAFVGLTGPREVLEKVWKDYFVYQQRGQVDEQGNYLIDHTARIYLVDQEGNLHLTFPFGMESSDIVADIEYLLRQ